jgi:hypothetical protein
MGKATSVAAILVGTLVVGSLLGFGVSHMLCRDKLMAYGMANIDHISTYVAIQRFKGTAQTYESSLNDFLVALDEQERAGPGLFSGQAVPVDRALTYIRLSLLALQKNDLDAAAKYRAQAETLCPRLGWKSCSADEMTQVVKRLDAHSMWNPSRAASDNGS